MTRSTWTVLFYLSSILLANLLVIWFGIIKIGPLVTPAGALVVGLTFSARDFVQRAWGKWRAWIWMLVASAITMLFSRDVAVASVLAFLAAEAVDWLVYTCIGGPFRRRIILSNLFGTPLDSLIFVPLVFGWYWPAIVGQAIVKFGGSLLVLPFIWHRED
jgi:hypothetical protein